MRGSGEDEEDSIRSFRLIRVHTIHPSFSSCDSKQKIEKTANWIAGGRDVSLTRHQRGASDDCYVFI